MQIVAQVLVAELARLRVLVQAAVLELALGLQLEWEPPVVRVPELELALVLAQGRESTWQQELAAVLERVRELRVSRQLEQQQHRLQAAAQELLPYRPVLPMKAPC